MIEVDELTKHFGMTLALDRLSFKVEKGEILGFLGPNGAGKTTTMRILTGFLAPTSGSARIAGFNVIENSYDVRKKIGYLPEAIPLYKDMRVREYLYYVAALKGIPRPDRSQQIQNVFQKCGLHEVDGRLIGKISKGFRQRVGLAQALIGDPEVLILDEPTEGLDPKQIIEIRQLIQSLGGLRTVILSTHILPEASMICQRVIILNKGKLIAVDTPENLDRNLQGKAIISLGARGPLQDLVSTLNTIQGITSLEHQPSKSSENVNYFKIETADDVDIRGRLAAAIVHGNWELLELHRKGMTLEDIFVHLVTQEEVDS